MGIGIDFGTTNSVVASATQKNVTENVHVEQFSSAEGEVANFRSVIFFPEEFPPDPKNAVVGPRALESYHEHGAQGRFLQSLKSFLTSSFESTRVGSRRYTLEELISLILKGLLQSVTVKEDEVIVVGRPVNFVNALCVEDNQRAEARLRKAFSLIGFNQISFEFEPVAAAYSYEQKLTQDELLLVGDFGGGTSDFSLIQVGPGAKNSARRMLGTSGVGVAGDAFDACIVRNTVVPHLGKGATYTTLTGLQLEIPHWLYTHVSNWYQLAMLKDPKNLKLLYDISLLTTGKAKEGVTWLMALIEENLSYFLYQSVAKTKCALSSSDTAIFDFHHTPLSIDELVKRKAFEVWIAESLSKMRDCVHSVLRDASVSPSQVNRVFLTGGSAFVPAVRSLFAEMFGADKIAGGNEFTSVAGGLALRAREIEKT